MTGACGDGVVVAAVVRGGVGRVVLGSWRGTLCSCEGLRGDMVTLASPGVVEGGGRRTPLAGSEVALVMGAGAGAGGCSGLDDLLW